MYRENTPVLHHTHIARLVTVITTKNKKEFPLVLNIRREVTARI
jgi:hypothetical protein